VWSGTTQNGEMRLRNSEMRGKGRVDGGDGIDKDNLDERLNLTSSSEYK
jgi:hypothetical protein